VVLLQLLLLLLLLLIPPAPARHSVRVASHSNSSDVGLQYVACAWRMPQQWMREQL
jgi:hypothetical protein